VAAGGVATAVIVSRESSNDVPVTVDF
jgi:hypothetical protein